MLFNSLKILLELREEREYRFFRFSRFFLDAEDDVASERDDEEESEELESENRFLGFECEYRVRGIRIRGFLVLVRDSSSVVDGL